MLAFVYKWSKTITWENPKYQLKKSQNHKKEKQRPSLNKKMISNQLNFKLIHYLRLFIIKPRNRIYLQIII